MKKIAKNTWLLGAQISGVLLIIILTMSVITAVLIAPTETHKQAMQNSIDTQRDFLKTGSYDSDTAAKTVEPAIERDIARYQAANAFISLMLVIVSLLVGHRYIRARSKGASIETVTTLAVATPFVIGGLISPAIINSIVGTNGWAFVVYGSWLSWMMALVSALMTLLLVGAAVHLLEKRSKKRHSFEIE